MCVFSKVGLSPVTEVSPSDPRAPSPLYPALMDKVRNGHPAVKKWRCFGPRGHRGQSFSWLFTMHTCVVLHLHIEGVLSIMALADKGGERKDWLRSKVGRMTELRGGQPHFWTFRLLRPLQPSLDLKWLRIAPQLGITFSSTVLSHIKMFYFCLSTQHFSLPFWLSYTFFFGEILCFQNGRSNLRTPHWTLSCDEVETRTVATLEKDHLAFFCVFFCTCVCACVSVSVIRRAWMCGCVKVAHEYTVQYGFCCLPPWRINAWTEPCQGANISETITLYSVDNC